jgi:cytidylate kinase
MLALTVGGQAGSGGLEIGYVLAGGLNARYVRHLAVRRLARRLNATVDAVSRKELSFASRWQRLVAAAESAFLRMGYYGYDPTGGMALTRIAMVAPDVRTSPGDISDREYVDAVYETAAQFASAGDIVLVKRAGSLTLKRFPEVVHIGLFASKDARTARMARRLGVGMADAADALAGLERARRAWFQRLGGDDPADPALYDIRLHTDLGETDGRVAWRAIEALRDLKPGLSFSALGLRPSPLVEEHPAVA